MKKDNLTLGPKAMTASLSDIVKIERNFVNIIDIEVIKLEEDVKLPTYEHNNFDNSGMDFYTTEEIIIHPQQTILIKTGLAMAIPRGLELQIRPTSGNSLKTKLRIANSPGTIDASYRGEIGIIVENIGSNKITIQKGAKIAQGVLCPIYHANFIEVDSLDKTSRNKDGFGSTGTI